MSDEAIAKWQELDRELNKIQDLLVYARSRSYTANEDLKLYQKKLNEVSESTFWNEYKEFRALKDNEIKALSKAESYKKPLLIGEIRDKKEETLKKIKSTKSTRDYLKKEIEEIKKVKEKAGLTQYTLEGEFEVVRAAKQKIHFKLKTTTP